MLEAGWATMLSVGGVSLLALVGALALVIDPKIVKRALRPTVALAIGVLVGEAALHLIPESMEKLKSVPLLVGWVGLGVAIFATLDLSLRRWKKKATDVAQYGLVSAVAEGFHNAIDGAFIATAYMADMHAGLAATLAVVLHEIPHELGNVAVLLHAGYAPKRAVAINLISASAALGGALLILCLNQYVGSLTQIAEPVAAGGFLYLAIVCLAPEVWRSASQAQKSAQGAGAVLGFILSAGMAWLH